jgi:lysyl-tRNA synthetase class 2
VSEPGVPLRPDLLRARGAIVAGIRRWFDENGYIEVHTPTLVSCPALEEHLEPVRVGDRYLHTSPEFAMKRVLASGLPRIYQMTPCFREEEVGVHHAREFTMLEWYRAGAGTPELMRDVEALIGAASAAIGQPAPRFQRRAVADLMAEAGHTDDGDEEAWFRCWVDRVEPALTEPTIVHGYPAWQAALAAVTHGVADRFELYLAGIEIGNAFAEETDATELRERFARSAAARAAAGRVPHPVDEALLSATPRMPRAAGIAVGVDRLVMALTGATEIAAVQVR